ncbi:MAG TPA: amidohydrolase family protein [Ktedonobacteraceae bacterium]
MRRITLEEHFTTQTFQKYLREQGGQSSGAAPAQPSQLMERLLEVGSQRLRGLDEAGIDVQVLSLNAPGLELVPGADAVALAREINDELAEMIRRHPTRFAGFAALPTLDPQAAANELERAVRQLGLKGAMLHGQPAGGYLDEQRYWEIFARAEALDVPLYLHPTVPAPGTSALYTGSPELPGPFWSFTVDAATQALRLVVSGIFDQFPKLTIILGHLGETLPYLLGRLDSRWQFYTGARRAGELPSHYIRNNFLVTTSGIFYDPALLCAVSALGAERVLFSVDFPYEQNKVGADWLDAAPLSEEERQKIAALNAEHWLHL